LRFLKLYCNVVDAWVLCASSINEKTTMVLRHGLQNAKSCSWKPL
jgi:hypothetical protein